MYGININCKDIDYIAMILAHRKTIETRRKNTLKSLVGQRVGLIRTGKGPAMLVGYATISAVKVYEDKKSFRRDYKQHRVKPRSAYDITDRKHGYILTDVVACDPVPVTTRGIAFRKLPDIAA